MTAAHITGKNAKHPETKDEVVAVLSAAVDEIYELRAVLACEARILEAHAEYKTFPKSRRQVALDSIERMRVAARGGWRQTMVNDAYRHRVPEMRAAGVSETLTNWQWLEQSGFVTKPAD